MDQFISSLSLYLSLYLTYLSPTDGDGRKRKWSINLTSSIIHYPLGIVPPKMACDQASWPSKGNCIWALHLLFLGGGDETWTRPFMLYLAWQAFNSQTGLVVDRLSRLPVCAHLTCCFSSSPSFPKHSHAPTISSPSISWSPFLQNFVAWGVQCKLWRTGWDRQDIVMLMQISTLPLGSHPPAPSEMPFSPTHLCPFPFEVQPLLAGAGTFRRPSQLPPA